MKPPLGQWLTLQEASGRLDVHPATLRLWADRGRVRSFRTPGGHRRFLEEDIKAIATEARAPELDLLMTAAVGRARLEAGGRLAEQGWYGRLDEAARQRHRELGRELVRLLVEYLRDTSPDVLEAAQAVGRQYGAAARREGLSVGQAMRTFLTFNEMLEASVEQVASLQGQPDLHRQVLGFVGEVLVAMVEEFSEVGG